VIVIDFPRAVDLRLDVIVPSDGDLGERLLKKP
jgi:hypothetical protein